jgi:hypothetical protein
VGIDAILLDPGGCWGQRDCPVAAGLLEACGLILERGMQRMPSGRGPRAG